MRKLALPTAVTLVLLTFIGCKQAPDNYTAQMDSIFKDFTKETPGCAVAIVKNGEVIFKKGYGMANLEYDIPISSTSIFDIASVSKQFAGFAISKLIEEGKISADDDIHKYVPEVPDFGKQITIRHLLHHTSGLRDWPEALHAAGWRWDEKFSFSDIMRMVKNQKDLDFEPGSKYSYSNTGYNLLAVIVEKVSGQTFLEYTRDNIFTPLRMDHSQFMDDEDKLIPNMAYSYSPNGNTFSKEPNTLTAAGSSSLYTNVEDLARWVINFDAKLSSNDPVYTRMLTEDRLNNGDTVHYGFGVGLDKVHGRELYAHTGGWAGYRTIISNFKNEHLSIIILSNHGSFDISGVTDKVVEVFLGPNNDVKADEDVAKPEPVALNEKLATNYLGTFKLGEGWYVTFTLEDGSMMVQATDESKFLMTPTSDSTFWVDAYKAGVTFVADKAGKVDKLRYKKIIAPRVEVVVITPADLKTYTGTYYSKELLTEYFITYENDQLSLYQQRHGALEITVDPIEKDVVSSPLGRIKFERNNNGAVTGLLLSGGRIRNIKFEKR